MPEDFPPKNLLDKTEDQLWERLGQELDEGIGAFPRSPAEAIGAAKRFWKRYQDKISSAVCHSPKVRQAVDAADSIALYAAIADVLLDIFTGSAAATAAALVLKRGVELMCGTIWAGVTPADGK